jgi:hypothetical protein
LGELSHEQIIAAVIGLLAVIGGVIIMLSQIFKKLGIVKCHDVCPEPQCQDLVKETRDNAAMAADAVIKSRESIIALQQGQKHVQEALEQKRIKIEGLQKDTTEIKTDVKWIVRELRHQNET